MTDAKTMIVPMLTGTILLVGCADMGGFSNAVSQSPQQQAASSCKFFSTKMWQGALFGALGTALVQEIYAKHEDKKVSTKDRIIAIIGGGGAGAAVGKYLDNRDCEAAKVAMQKMETAKVNQPLAWTSPGTGNSGKVTPTSVSQRDARYSGKLCRSFRQEVTLKDGKKATDDGVTCRDDNGDWTVVT
jgi:surface antigen